MRKSDLRVGMLAVTADGKSCLVLPTKNDGLVLMAEDNKALKLSKLADDLSNGSYREDKAIIEVYDIMDDVNGHVFDTTNREMLFDAEDDDYADDVEEIWDEEEEDSPSVVTDSAFTKANVTPGMLAVTRDGQNRLAIPTADMGLVLATEDSKFVRLDKLNDDLTIAAYRNDGKNVDKVYGLAAGVTTDFYSEANRPLLFER